MTNASTVAILAGGMGNRLKSRTGTLPKPMAVIAGKPVLEHLVEMCVAQGFSDIALLVHYEHQAISDYFGDGHRWGATLRYCVEEQPRGTAGALVDALPALADRFLVLYGDTFADVNLHNIWSFHAQKTADATMFVHPNDHPADSDLVDLDDEGMVKAIHGYPHPAAPPRRNLVNAALYVFEKPILEKVKAPSGKSDIAKDTLPALIVQGFRVCGYQSPEYIKDMGTPARLDKVEHDVSSGLVSRLSSRFPRSAIFIDRDGTINVDSGHVKSPAEFALLPGSAAAIRKINQAGTLAVCITNQPVLARGDADRKTLDAIHALMDFQLGDEHAYLDRLYVCPHHPDKGFPREVAALKIDCYCRKPKTGMIDAAVADLNIDRRSSWMVGDSSADILAGLTAGLTTVLVETGHAGRDGKYEAQPHYRVPDLLSAVELILQSSGITAK